jgi:acetyl esterase/lipase
MPSWQTHLFSAATRLWVKRGARKPVADEMQGARHVRRLFELPEFLRPSLPAGVKIEPVNEGGVRGEWVKHESNSQPPLSTVYYLHGGGYVACSPRTHRGLTSHLAIAASTKVFALDYRRAPEHKFPAALEDAVGGYRLLLDKGGQPGKIVIGGDSAGGGLAAALLIALRDRGLPLPSAAFLLSPWTDLAATGASLVTNEAADPMLSGRMTHKLAKLYYGDASPRDPLVSPLYGDLIGLPPLLIYVGDTEVLLDDSVRLAERAKRHGVNVDLRIEHELPHVWPVFVTFGLPEARKTIGEIAEFIRRRTSSWQNEGVTNRNAA